MDTIHLVDYLDELLDNKSFSDPSFNGLQVQGSETTQTIVTACTASLDAIDAAIELGADTLLVHHGLMWKGGNPRIVGAYKERIKALIENDINLIAYHLPLDAHESLGNNVYLAGLIGGSEFDYIKDGDPTSIGIYTNCVTPISVGDVCKVLAKELDTRVSVIGGSLDTMLSSFAICSGCGGFVLDECSNEVPFEALITGEINEQTYHMAQETGTVVFTCGHHASEQGGVRLLGEHLSELFNLEHKHLHFAYEKNTDWFEFDDRY